MAQLHYRHAAMNSGKSTMVLQYRHTYASCGRKGLLMTRLDRAGTGIVSSRIGLTADALEIGAAADLTELVLSQPGSRVDHVIVDEAQFLSPDQVDQLAALVDDHDIDVFAFGLLSDFRGLQFPGSARLVVLADIVEALQVYPMCWCGQPARMNARVVSGTWSATATPWSSATPTPTPTSAMWCCAGATTAPAGPTRPSPRRRGSRARRLCTP